MSRYIDADALMQKLDIKADCKECNAIDHYLCCLRSPNFVNACEAINDAPSIDIVRCRECKYASDNKVYGCMLELFNGNFERLYADDFCSYGERKSDE